MKKAELYTRLIQTATANADLMAKVAVLKHFVEKDFNDGYSPDGMSKLANDIFGWGFKYERKNKD